MLEYSVASLSVFAILNASKLELEYVNEERALEKSKQCSDADFRHGSRQETTG